MSSKSYATNWCDDANCQSCWLYEEGEGTSVADSSQNSNTLNATGDGVSWATASPPVGTSTAYIDLAGSNDYLSATHSADFDFADDFTLVSWANPDNTDFSGRVMYQYDGTSDDGFYLSQRSDGSGVWGFNIWVSATAVLCTSDAAPTGNWQHIVGIRDSDVLTLYVDGVAQADTETLSGAIDSSDSVYIGVDRSIANDYPGLLDEQAMFDKALNSTGINDIMDNGLEGAVAGWTHKWNSVSGIDINSVPNANITKVNGI